MSHRRSEQLIVLEKLRPVAGRATGLFHQALIRKVWWNSIGKRQALSIGWTLSVRKAVQQWKKAGRPELREMRKYVKINDVSINTNPPGFFKNHDQLRDLQVVLHGKFEPNQTVGM